MEQVEAALEACLGGGAPATSWPPPLSSVPATTPDASTKMHVEAPAPGPQTTLSSGVHGGPTVRTGRRRGVVIGGTALAVIALGVVIAASVGRASHAPGAASSASGDAAVIAVVAPPAAPPADAMAVVVEVPVPVQPPADGAVLADVPADAPVPRDAAAPRPKPSAKPKSTPTAAAPPAATPAPVPAADPCDLAGHTKRGQDESRAGTHGQAFVEFEAALRCKPGDPQLVALAYGEACLAHYTRRARHFYALLPATGAVSQAALRDVCERSGINPVRPRAQGSAPAPSDNE
jgi:hypothetical protein